MAASRPQVLVVGAGVTGSLLASLVKDAGLSVAVVEKSRGAGGRMMSHTFRKGDRSSPVLGRTDLGAQYITTRSQGNSELGPIYNSLLNAGVIVPCVGEIAGSNPYSAPAAEARPGVADGAEELKNFVAPAGLSSVAKRFIESAGVAVHWGQALEDLSIDTATGMPRVTLSNGSLLELASPGVVVFTQPVAQLLGQSKFPVRGNFMDFANASVVENLRKVEYSSRFAVAYYFEGFPWPHAWIARYFDSGDVRYLAHDTGKREVTDEPCTSVVVHSGVPMGLKFIDEEDPFHQAKASLQADLEQKMPEVPWASATSTKVQKWRYSQVYKGYGGLRPQPAWTYSVESAGAPGCVQLVETGRALVLVAGDALAPSSNFEGCVFSAKRSTEALLAYFARAAPQADL